MTSAAHAPCDPVMCWLTRSCIVYGQYIQQSAVSMRRAATAADKRRCAVASQPGDIVHWVGSRESQRERRRREAQAGGIWDTNTPQLQQAEEGYILEAHQHGPVQRERAPTVEAR